MADIARCSVVSSGMAQADHRVPGESDRKRGGCSGGLPRGDRRDGIATALLLTARTRCGGSRAAASFFDPNLDRRGLDLVWWNGPRCHRSRFYRSAMSQKSVCSTIRTPRAVRRPPMILTRLAFARRKL